MSSASVIGAGLAGSEAAWQLAQAGISVRLFEMRPNKPTAAHQTSDFAELVCSNSLGSSLPDRAGGVLQAELKSLDSQLLRLAQAHSVPAGQALAVDRDAFARAVTECLESHPLVEVVREEVTVIPQEEGVVIASGPLTSNALADDLAKLSGTDHLHFFDALAPVVTGESLNHDVVFRASRWQPKEEDGVSGDYLNVPLELEDYDRLVDGLLEGEKHALKDFESEDPRAHSFFERCLPVEILADRGRESLRFGPLRPVGLFNPHNGKRPYAVIQLRAENRAGTLWNLVGFQTNLRYPAQEALLRSMPGLEKAEFVRLGSMHRNTFLCSPKILRPTLEWRSRPGLFVAGQLTGMEGYLGNIGSGLIAGRNLAARLQGEEPRPLPQETLLGALALHVSEAPAENFQPMKAEFGILPPLPAWIRKNERKQERARRSAATLETFLAEPLLEPDSKPSKPPC